MDNFLLRSPLETGGLRGGWKSRSAKYGNDNQSHRVLMGNCLRLMTKDEFDVANHIQKTTKERLVNLFGPSSTDLVAAEVFFTPSFPIHEGLQRLHHQRERHSQNSWLSCSLKDLSKHKMRQLPVSGKLHASYHCHIPDSEQLGGL